MIFFGTTSTADDYSGRKGSKYPSDPHIPENDQLGVWPLLEFLIIAHKFSSENFFLGGLID